jgi:hypothetical protein
VRAGYPLGARRGPHPVVRHDECGAHPPGPRYPTAVQPNLPDQKRILESRVQAMTRHKMWVRTRPYNPGSFVERIRGTGGAGLEKCIGSFEKCRHGASAFGQDFSVPRAVGRYFPLFADSRKMARRLSTGINACGCSRTSTPRIPDRDRGLWRQCLTGTLRRAGHHATCTE